tara:strand:- start:977 stop:1561 length:585 start_codon:yes stop_codon:yes gene_type:complete
MKFEVFNFENVTSTNDVAIKLIKENQKKNGCICARVQTKGRGTRGKEWISERGNLFISIFFPLEDKYPPFNEFFIINPILISDVIKRFCNYKNVNLKFPNDVFVNNKKICGVLQETITSNNKKFLIVGIGINVISNPDIDNKYEATNILSETKKKPEIKEIVDFIILSYEKFFIELNLYNYKNFKKKADSMVLN